MNWYKKIKFANQYGVIGAYGFWIDPEGNILSVDNGLLHEGALEESGWLHPNWRQIYEHAYAAAAGYNFIRVAIEYDPISQDNSIMFDGCGGENPLTSEQKRIIHDMFLEFKRQDRHGEAYIDCISGVPYKRVHTVQEMDKLLQQMPTQASSNTMIKLAKMEEVKAKVGTQYKTIKYLVNPTRQEIIDFINRINFQNRHNEYRKDQTELRGIFINNALYVWDSWDSNHCIFCKAVGGGRECVNKYYKCYDDDNYNEDQNELFPSDALTFRVIDEDKLVTNIPSQHKNVGYFHNRGELQPYEGEAESKWGSPWTHVWQSDLA